jgi:hypothetical protein
MPQDQSIHKQVDLLQVMCHSSNIKFAKCVDGTTAACGWQHWHEEVDCISLRIAPAVAAVLCSTLFTLT